MLRPYENTGGAPLAPHRLNPTYWMGWVFLAQGSTLGHGAPRHQTPRRGD